MEEKNVLIVTPFSDFGRLVSESLSKDTSLRVKSLSTINAVDRIVESIHSLDYALIDLDFGMDIVRESVHKIRGKFPSTPLILISKKEPPPEVDDLAPWKLLRKPFVESDLCELFRRPFDLLTSKVIDAKFYEPSDKGIPIWARDNESLTKTLENVLPDLNVVEAFVYARDGIIAQTNTVEGFYLKGCTNILDHHLEESEQGEILKHVQVNSVDYLMHGTILAVGIILALLFHDDIPYRIVRKQSNYVAARVLNPHLPAGDMLALPEKVENPTDESLNKTIIEEVEGDTVKVVTRKSAESAKMIANETQSNVNVKESKELESLKSVDSESDQKSDPETGSKISYIIDRGVLVGERLSNEYNPDPLTGKSTETINMPSVKHLRKEEANIDLSQSVEREGDKIDISKNAPLSVESEHKSILPYTNRSKCLYYACLLIPRLKSNAIVNDLARFLSEEIVNIFLAYGWRLECLKIEKQYLQWIVMIPSTVSPAKHIQIVRKESSKMILGNFPRFSRGGLITDFWAPGYLLESGQNPIPEEVICEFVHANRQQYYPDESISSISESRIFTYH